MATNNNVGYVHRDLIEVLPYYQVVHDCNEGELVIKWRRERYLPKASRSDTSVSAKDRYETLLADAVFYNVLAAHVEFMTGQVFIRPPSVTLPIKLKPVLENIDGSGLSIPQLCQQLISICLLYSRYGLFVDYPDRDTATTQLEVDSGKISPTVTAYKPWRIANWRTEMRGGKRVLVLVVLHEVEDKTTDGYDHEETTHVRVLRLNQDNEYEVELFESPFLTELARFDRTDYNYFDSRSSALTSRYNNLYYTEYLASYPSNYLADFRIKTEFKSIMKKIPKGADGKPLNFIPFIFGGARYNTPYVERPALFDIASVCLALYRDSALNQQMLRVHGSGTPWFSGLNRQWIDRVMGGKLALGSTAAIKLPTGGSAGMLQGAANSSIREAMQDKWNHLAALGARVLAGSQGKQTTATEFSLETSEFNSGLALIAQNVSQAVTEALKFAGKFVGVITKEPKVDLLTDYGFDRLSPQQRHQLMVEVQGNLITWSEARSKLTKSGIATLSDEEARREIEEEGVPQNKAAKEFQEKQFKSNQMAEAEDGAEDDLVAEDEKKKELQAKADGMPKDGEKAGGESEPPSKKV